jgi:ppGpp synthetase/RelA/SpoT-type nucleotidyltranferase
MNLKEFVASYYSPETKHSDAARDEFTRRREASEKIANQLHLKILGELEGKSNLRSRNQHFYSLSSKSERFLAFLTPVSLKQPDRLATKLKDVMIRNPEYSSHNWWWHAKDLARFRIVTANLSDLLQQRDLIAQILIRASKDPERIFLSDHIKDYIWTEPNERHNASKSLHFRICNSERNTVEVQLMTLLQYSWDQIQHWLYEIQRAASNSPTGLDKNVERSYWALSNSLFVLDEYIVSLDGNDPRNLREDVPPDLSACILPLHA